MLLLFLDQLCITYTFTSYTTCGKQYENVWSPPSVTGLQSSIAPAPPQPHNLGPTSSHSTVGEGGGGVRPPEGESQKTTRSVGTPPWVVVCNDNVLEQHHHRDWTCRAVLGLICTLSQTPASTQLQQRVNDTLAVPEEARLDSNLGELLMNERLGRAGAQLFPSNCSCKNSLIIASLQALNTHW